MQKKGWKSVNQFLIATLFSDCLHPEWYYQPLNIN